MKRTNYLLYTNDIYHIDEDEYRQMYAEFLVTNELKESDEDFWDFIYDSFDLDWQDLCANMEYCACDGECVVTGSLGLWHGEPTIEPKRADCIIDAIGLCNGRDIEYLTIRKVNGHLEVEAAHHDGRNRFEIHLLNTKGVNAGELADLSNRCYHKAMPDYLF